MATVNFFLDSEQKRSIGNVTYRDRGVYSLYVAFLYQNLSENAHTNTHKCVSYVYNPITVKL